MRTESEIIEKMKEKKKGYSDFFGAFRGDIIIYLSAESAKEFIKEDANLNGWNKFIYSDEDIKIKIIDYLPFAWEKANNCRGLSAARSMDHMAAWLWLLGFDEASEALKDYDRYGKPQLREISEFVGFDWKSHDDGRWTNEELEEGVKADEVPRINLKLNLGSLP